MTWERTLVFFGCLALLLVSRAGVGGEIIVAEDVNAATEPAGYRSPESFIDRRTPQEFLDHAKTFLKDHPDDERAPRILDMLIVATVVRNDAEARNAKLRLLVEHPWSLVAGYVAKTTPAKEVASLLKERFNQREPPLDRMALAQLGRSIERCLREYGREFADDEIMAAGALSNASPTAAAQYRQEIRDPDSDAAKTLDIALDDERPAREKFLGLQPLHGYGPARAFQAYLYREELADDDRADMNVRTVVAENLLRNGEFDDARPLLAELCGVSKDPRVHFWLAWAEAALDDVPRAIATLEGMQREFPGSPWTESAEELRPVLETLESALKDQGLALDRMLMDLWRKPPDVLQLNVEWGDAVERRIRVYLSLDLPQDALELVVRSDSTTQLAYRTGPGECRFLLGGELAIHSFAGKGVCPAGTFSINQKAADDSASANSFGYSFKTVPQGSGGLTKTLENLIEAVRTLDDRQELLRDLVGAGSFPAPIQIDGKEKVLLWLRPQWNDPDMLRFEMRLTDDDRLSSIRHGDSWSVTDIRYGPRRSTALTPPAWPDLPVESGEELGPSGFFRLWGAAAALFDTKKPEPSDATATKKTPDKR